MAHSEQLNELATALAKAQAEFGAVPKTSTNPFFKSKYADLAESVQTAAPIITKLGLSVAQFISSDEQGDTLTTWLLHSSGQFINSTMKLHLSKDDAQGQGSATTYARRYSYMAALGLVADEDDDGNAAAHKPATASKPSNPAPTTPTLTSDQISTLMQLAKSKGYKTKNEAVTFLNIQTDLADFTKVPTEQYDQFKKRVISSGWNTETV